MLLFKKICIRFACNAFGITDACCLYQAILTSENALISDLLIQNAEQGQIGGLVCALNIFVILRASSEITNVFAAPTVNLPKTYRSNLEGV